MSTGSLVRETLAQGAHILRLEAALVRHEISQNLKAAGVALGLVVGGAILSSVALTALAGAGVAGLVAVGLDLAWAALLVGSLVALAAAILIGAGLNRLDPERLLPRRAIANVKRDAAILQERTDGRA